MPIIVIYLNIYTHLQGTCCELRGTTQWEFKNKRVLPCPVGISVDNDGNVDAAGFNYNDVVIISPCGLRHRNLLSSSDGLRNPRLSMPLSIRGDNHNVVRITTNPL
jgi:hypothetical protein